MTLIVETGTGLDTAANSYVSLVEADAYVATMPSLLRDPWLALTLAADRENLLIYSTRVLDQRATYNGSKTVSASPLRWPRSNVFDCDDLSAKVLMQSLQQYS